MRPFQPPPKDTEEIVGETLKLPKRLELSQAEINCAIAQSESRIAHTGDILKRLDSALARFNGKL
jgi:hypothetical protein